MSKKSLLESLTSLREDTASDIDIFSKWANSLLDWTKETEAPDAHQEERGFADGDYFWNGFGSFDGPDGQPANSSVTLYLTEDSEPLSIVFSYKGPSDKTATEEKAPVTQDAMDEFGRKFKAKVDEFRKELASKEPKRESAEGGDKIDFGAIKDALSQIKQRVSDAEKALKELPKESDKTPATTGKREAVLKPLQDIEGLIKDVTSELK